MSEWLHVNEHLVVFAIFVSDLVGTVFLIIEYYYGRPDVAIKHDAIQQKRMRQRKEVIKYEKEMD